MGQDREQGDAQSGTPLGIPPASPPPHMPVKTAAKTPPRSRIGVLYPNAYVWFVFLSALDVMLTYLILNPFMFFADNGTTESRGSETNALANWVIQRWDVPGMVAFKFVIVALVIVLCEVIGHHKGAVGRRLAEWAVAITSIPVIVALIQMGLDLYFWFYPPP
jgi:hypothetical protein